MVHSMKENQDMQQQIEVRPSVFTEERENTIKEPNLKFEQENQRQKQHTCVQVVIVKQQRLVVVHHSEHA